MQIVQDKSAHMSWKQRPNLRVVGITRPFCGMHTFNLIAKTLPSQSRGNAMKKMVHPFSTLFFHEIPQGHCGCQWPLSFCQNYDFPPHPIAVTTNLWHALRVSPCGASEMSACLRDHFFANSMHFMFFLGYFSVAIFVALILSKHPGGFAGDVIENSFVSPTSRVVVG